MTRFRLEIGKATDVGRQRERNEDCFATYVPRVEEKSALTGLVLLADGMGGERGGAEASRLAVECVLEEVSADARGAGTGYLTHKDLVETLRRVVRETSDRIFELGKTEPALRGLGSTLVGVAFLDDEALVANVGDSRCYRVRHGKIARLTEDHTWVAGQVEAGVLTAEDAQSHPQRSVLTRTLGDAISPGVDVHAEDVEHDDLYILCSDGLSNALTDDEILEIARRFLYAQDLAEALVALAKDKDGSDNITAVACRCREAGDQDEPDDTEPILRHVVADRPPPWRRRWLLLGVLVLALVAGVYFGPRHFAVRAFERGVRHAEDGQYLHARQEFSNAIRLGLDQKRTEQLIDLLLTFPSTNRDEGGED